MNTPVFETASARNDVLDALAEADIETRPFFYPLHDQPPYKSRSSLSSPVATDLYQRGVNLPSSPLLSDDELEYVCRVVNDAVSES